MSAKGWLATVAVLVLAVSAAGYGRRSGLEGKVVDGAGKPLAGRRVTADQVTPIKGYEHFETVTGSDGTFRFSELFPVSEYVLRTWVDADTWTMETSLRGKSGPEGSTSVLRTPMALGLAVSRDGRSIVDPRTGAVRFTASSEGVITDSQTSLQWVVGLDQSTNETDAAWRVKNENAAGEGWRMPTLEELRTLYAKCFGLASADSVLGTPGRWVWADSETGEMAAWYFVFAACNSKECDQRSYSSFRVFGVRSFPRR